MRGLVVIGLLLTGLTGCMPGPMGMGPMDGAMVGPQYPTPPAVVYPNPVFVPLPDNVTAWETVVDVIDDYFKIEHEEPVRLIGNTLTEGRIDTFSKTAATMLEPWQFDSVGQCEQLEATLQSMRRRAVVRVIPTEGGYLVDVAVYKELEDVQQPEHATAGAATFRYDGSLTRVVNPAGGQEVDNGWISLGRDVALQQRIIAHLGGMTKQK